MQSIYKKKAYREGLEVPAEGTFWEEEYFSRENGDKKQATW